MYSGSRKNVFEKLCVFLHYPALHCNKSTTNVRKLFVMNEHNCYVAFLLL